MFKSIVNAFKTPEIRKKIFYTILLLVLFRLGCFLTIPMVNIIKLQTTMDAGANSVVGLINVISGGAFSRLSIFAMSITPFITSSIVVQLLGMIVPSLEKMMKEGGEEGRKKIDRLTKVITLVLAIIEAIGIYISYKNSGIFAQSKMTGFIVVISLVAGSQLLAWLGDKITTKGIGNGISMLIFAGIVSSIPAALTQLGTLVVVDGAFSTVGLIKAILLVLAVLVLVVGVVFVTLAERRIPVQYSKKVVGRRMVGAQNTHIPIKPALANVMPIIFASSFMTFPAMVIQLFVHNIENTTGFWRVIYNLSIATYSSTTVGWHYTIINAIIYLVLIVGFTYFYTYATFNPAEISSTIKQNGGFIPGIRAGKPTTEYLTNVLTKITLFGALFLAAIAVIPMLARGVGLNTAFGGTSILIVVGVAIELGDQLKSQLVMRHYKGFLEK